MPFNLLKIYNQLLELAAMSERERKGSLRAIFDRDITNNPQLAFRAKQINPTPAEGAGFDGAEKTNTTCLRHTISKAKTGRGAR